MISGQTKLLRQELKCQQGVYKFDGIDDQESRSKCFVYLLFGSQYQPDEADGCSLIATEDYLVWLADRQIFYVSKAAIESSHIVLSDKIKDVDIGNVPV